MKKKNFLVIICLFLGAGLSQLSGQNEDRSYSVHGDWYFWLPIICDGQEVDVVEGVMPAHEVINFTDGELDFSNCHQTGAAKSAITDETFHWNAIRRWDEVAGTMVVNFNLKGNMGSKYNGKYLIDLNLLPANPIIPLHINCR